MLEIHIEQIKAEGLKIEIEESAQTFPVLADMAKNGECDFEAPIKASLRALRIEDMVQVDGNIQTSIRLQCSRCLQTFETKMESDFSLTFAPHPADVPDENELQEVELSAEDMGFVHYKGDKIDLKNTIQEQLVMEFPLRAICRQDCKGLCPKCGTDLNVEACGCDRQPASGKFTVLKNIKLEK